MACVPKVIREVPRQPVESTKKYCIAGLNCNVSGLELCKKAHKPTCERAPAILNEDDSESCCEMEIVRHGRRG